VESAWLTAKVDSAVLFDVLKWAYAAWWHRKGLGPPAPELTTLDAHRARAKNVARYVAWIIAYDFEGMSINRVADLAYGDHIESHRTRVSRNIRHVHRLLAGS
jgi:hypothetical protein